MWPKDVQTNGQDNAMEAKNIVAERRKTQKGWVDDTKEVTRVLWQRKAKDRARWKTLGEIFVQEWKKIRSGAGGASHCNSDERAGECREADGKTQETVVGKVQGGCSTTCSRRLAKGGP